MSLGSFRLLAASAVLAACLLCSSCADGASYEAESTSLADGGDYSTSLRFALNHRPVRLELLVRVDSGKAIVELDHPDGRTTDSLEIDGPGLRAVRKEFPKEPGSWGLRVAARGGSVRFWEALHDRPGYAGPNEEARLAVEGRR